MTWFIGILKCFKWFCIECIFCVFCILCVFRMLHYVYIVYFRVHICTGRWEGGESASQPQQVYCDITWNTWLHRCKGKFYFVSVFFSLYDCSLSYSCIKTLCTQSFIDWVCRNHPVRQSVCIDFFIKLLESFSFV